MRNTNVSRVDEWMDGGDGGAEGDGIGDRNDDEGRTPGRSWLAD